LVASDARHSRPTANLIRFEQHLHRDGANFLRRRPSIAEE
jgi:hypothetical protein